MKQSPMSEAFTLVEVMIYITGTMFISLAALSLFLVTQKTLAQGTYFYENSIRTMIVFDLMKRDLMSGSIEPAWWDEQAFIWRKETLTQKGLVHFIWVGWQIDDHGVMRIEGVYDSTQRRWLKKQSSFFGCPLQSISLQLVYSSNKMVKTARVLSSDKTQKSTEMVVALRNRVLS